MTVELMFPHIEKSDGKPSRLKNQPRIRVAQIVMDYLVHGWSVEEMCRQHPYLTPGEAHAAMSYYYDHQYEIDGEIAEEYKRYEEVRAKAPPSPFFLRLRAKGLL